MPLPQNFERAQLVVDGGEPIECAFNPQEYSITKTNVWTIKPVTGTDTPKPEFGGGMPWTIRVQLLLDASLKGADASIKEDAMKLLKMMEAGGGGGGGSAPPFVTFKWGSIESPKMVGSSLNIRFVMFRPNGEPARALVDLELTQSGKAQEGQNPTTRAQAGLKVVFKMISSSGIPRCRNLDIVVRRSKAGPSTLRTCTSLDMTSGRNPAASRPRHAWKPNDPAPCPMSKVTPRSRASSASSRTPPSPRNSELGNGR